MTPFSNLSPDLILSAIESLGYSCSGNLLALNSYENRVYQIGLEESNLLNSTIITANRTANPEENPRVSPSYLIVKFYRPERWTNQAILEEHEFAKEVLDLEIPVVAPLIINNQSLHHFEEHRFALFPRQGGRALELGNLDHLEWMGRFIGRLHAMSACRPFQHRARLDTQSYGQQSFDYLIKNNFIPKHLIQSFSNTVTSILEIIENNFQKIKPTYIRLHGDCHPGNVLWNDHGPQIVDLDDCIMGPAIQDIWMLLSGDEQQSRAQLNQILQGYYEFHDFDPREIQLIQSLRTLRMLHYAAWLARRWDDPAFPLYFPFFNTAHYWPDLLKNLEMQLFNLNEEN